MCGSSAAMIVVHCHVCVLELASVCSPVLIIF